ncbi:MAG: FecR domain-containing protein [Dysgonamonadaceae bacterium]|jgi:ferric-dicitrate binding protein FerR (iron transport regulator)|nr:FecR domain-containing protein [Dysgonamonadaceae bacterium]
MKIDRYILDRYFCGESPEEEKESIREWLESDEAHRKQFIRERIRFDASVVADESDIAGDEKAGWIPYRWRTFVRNAMKAAAVVVLMIVSSHFYSTYRINGLVGTAQNAYVPPGSRTSLALADGSAVWLNSNTTLKYPGFFRDERVVELDGEGFFDIAKDAGKPFTINTGKYVLEALGTSFNMESYADRPGFETAMFTGRVKLYKIGAKSDTVYLSAGETATLDGDSLVISATNYNKYRWKEGIIVFEDKSFEEMMILFEKYFDVKIIIRTDAVRKLGYLGKFRIVDGIDHALRVLQNDFRFTYRREENTNIIYIM